MILSVGNGLFNENTIVFWKKNKNIVVFLEIKELNIKHVLVFAYSKNLIRWVQQAIENTIWRNHWKKYLASQIKK